MSEKTWAARIEKYEAGEPIEPTKLNALRSVFRHSMFITRPDQSYLEGEVLYGDNQRLPLWSITEEQKVKGLEWLTRPKIFNLLSDRNKEIVKEWEDFLFAGVWVEWGGWGTLFQNAFLVYRCIGESGKWFDYYAAWGNPKASDQLHVMMEGN